MALRIGILDDHALFTEALSAVLRANDAVGEVRILNDERQWLPWLRDFAPNVLLLDVMMPHHNGADLLAAIHKEFKGSVRMMVLSSRTDQALVHLCMAAGASGFCSKNTPVAELLHGVDVVMQGGTYICSKLKLSLERDAQGPTDLSDREMQVLQLLHQGLSSKVVADRLFITEHTVNSHRKRMLQKFAATSTAEMLNKAVKYGVFAQEH